MRNSVLGQDGSYSKMVEDTDSAVRDTGRPEPKVGEPVPIDAAPRDRLMQLVGWFAAVVLALAIATVVFVPTAHWLAQHDIVPGRGPLLQAAGFAARGQFLTLCAGLFAAGALLGVAQSTSVRPRLKLLRQWQATRRYTKAIEHLGSDKLGVRTSGIYALGRVARRDSGRTHPAVMEVLTAFIRERSHDQGPAEPGRPIRSDVQAALTVIGRRDHKRDIRPIDLTGAVLTHAYLVRAELSGADLTGAHLIGANLYDGQLTRAQLAGADLTRAHLACVDLAGAQLKKATLRGADLTDAKLDGADLRGTDLYGADLIRADLTDADLYGADLAFADLYGASLTGARLFCADLHDARLTRADLTGADLTGADLCGADLVGAKVDRARLTGARWHRATAVPGGRALSTRADLLKLAGPDPRHAELVSPVQLRSPKSANGQARVPDEEANLPKGCLIKAPSSQFASGRRWRGSGLVAVRRAAHLRAPDCASRRDPPVPRRWRGRFLPMQGSLLSQLGNPKLTTACRSA